MSEMSDILFEEARRRLSQVRNIIAVTAGKGGVGKSFVSTSLALALAERGKKVGLLDLDVHGSSVPLMLSLKEEVRAGREGFRPVRKYNIEIMSIGLLTKDSPVLIKGKDKMDLITSLVALTNWGELDYLVIDLPPGTGDEVLWVIRVIRNLRSAGALVVTIPSMLSRSVVRKSLRLLVDEGIRILGLVENMSYFKCGKEEIRPFGYGSGEDLAKEFKTRLLARLPIEPRVEKTMGEGYPPYLASNELKTNFSSLAAAVESLLQKA